MAVRTERLGLVEYTGATPSEIPVIDLGWEEGIVVKRIEEACVEWGFFQVVNHSVCEKAILGVESAVEDFFVSAPQRERDAVRRSRNNARGYFNNELTKQRPDHKEGFDAGFEGHFEIDGANRWPTTPGFQDKVQRYLFEIDAFAKRVFHLMVLGLGLEAKSFDSEFSGNTSWMRLNYYPPCSDRSVVEESFGNSEPDTAKDGVFSINRHTDAGALTVLYHRSSDPASLQVFSRKLQKFVRVAPLPGSFTINVGDALQVWSNDKYKSPVHRVLAHPTQTRISIPFFLNPNFESVCRSHIPESISPAKYLPFMWGEFRRLRFEGDFADTGTEIQISDWLIPTSKL